MPKVHGAMITVPTVSPADGATDFMCSVPTVPPAFGCDAGIEVSEWRPKASALAMQA